MEVEPDHYVPIAVPFAEMAPHRRMGPGAVGLAPQDVAVVRPDGDRVSIVEGEAVRDVREQL